MAALHRITIVIALTLAAAPALAHPMGNYSINQYWLVDARGESLDLFYLLDIAEVPSLKELDRLDPDFDSQVTESERDDYLSERIPEILDGLSFQYNGERVPLTAVSHRLNLLQGMGGMTVFNIVMRLRPDGIQWPPQDFPVTVEVASDLYLKQTGVRECMVVVDGQYDDLTEGLGDRLKYQTLMLWDDNLNPLYQDYDAQFLIKLGESTENIAIERPTQLAFDWTSTARSAATMGETEIAQGLSQEFSQTMEAANQATDDGSVPPIGTTAKEPMEESAEGEWIARVQAIIEAEEMPFPLFVAGLLIAVMMGAGHAMSPGHGKTVMAAYLIGERGTYWHAFLLGVIVTITHTWSVLLLGVVVLYLQDYVAPEDVDFWAGIASGVIIMVLGVYLFRRRFESYILSKQAVAHDHDDARSHDHDHHHHHHDHDHDHSHAHLRGHDHIHHDHDHDHHHGPGGHTHVIETEDGAPPSFWQILTLGISGGIVPCPAALIVLMLAISVGRLSYGLLFILAFSVGLAAVLVAIGFVVVKTAGAIRSATGERSPVLKALPVFSSILITILGGWVVLMTLIRFDIVAFLPRG